MTRAPQQATAYITGASAWHTEVQWCGRYDPGREETNTILITTQSTRPEPPTKPTMFSNSSRVDSRSAPLVSPCGAINRAKPRADKGAFHLLFAMSSPIFVQPSHPPLLNEQ